MGWGFFNDCFNAVSNAVEAGVNAVVEVAEAGVDILVEAADTVADVVTESAIALTVTISVFWKHANFGY